MQIIFVIAVIPLLLILPGALTFWGVLLRLRDSQDNPGGKYNASSNPPDLLEAIGMSVAASILVTSLAAFTLVFLEIFALWLLLSVVGTYVLLAAVTTGLLYRRELLAPRSVRFSVNVFQLLLMFIAVGSSFALYSTHSEDLLLYRDPAAYVNTAVHIARYGTPRIDDSLYSSLERNLQDSLTFEFPVDSVKDRYDGYQIEYRFRGFPRDEGAAYTAQQFFNLFPTWQAIGYSLLGIEGAYLVSPLFGALSVLFVFLLARRLFGPVAAVVAALLLSVNLAQFWYARAPASEVLTQTVFLAAMLFWVLYSSAKVRTFGIFAGIGLGGLMLVRVDSVLVIGTTLLFLLYLLATRRLGRRDLFFIAPLAFVSAFGIIDGLYSSRSYVEWVYVSTAHKSLLLGALGSLFLFAIFARLTPRGWVSGSISSIEAGHAKKIQAVLAIGLLGLAAFAYFLRPELTEQVISLNLFGERLPSNGGETFVQLGWYLTIPGLVLAVAGAVIAVTRKMNRGAALFLAVGFAVAIYYLIEPRIRPDHFWAIRRFVPIVIPMGVIFIGLSIQTLYMARSEKQIFPANVLFDPRIFRGAATGIVLALFLYSIWQVSDFVSYREWEGSVSAVDDVGNRFPEGSVIIFENSWLGSLLAPPLKIIYGHETFVVSPPGALQSHETLCGSDSEYPSSLEPQSCVLSEFATFIKDRPVFWVTERDDTQPKIVQERFVKLDDYRINIAVPKLEEPFDRLPRRSGVFTWKLSGNVYMLDTNSSTTTAKFQEIGGH